MLSGDVHPLPGPENRKSISVRISQRTRRRHGNLHTEKVNHKRSEVRTIINIPTISEQSPNIKTHLRLCCLNPGSIKSKSADFVCYAASTGANIYTSTETWLTERDMAKRAELTLPGFKLLDQPRLDRTGGGLALLIKSGTDAKKVGRW